MSAGLLVGAVRQVWGRAFNALPPLASPVALPATASHLRYSLLRSLQALSRKVTRYQIGGTEFSEMYILTQVHANVLWRSMRNRMACGYFDINLDVVWETVQGWLPALLKQLTAARQDAEFMNNSTGKEQYG